MTTVCIAHAHRTSIRAAALALLVAVPALVGGPAAGAEVPVHEAQRLYQEGLQSYRAGDHDGAVAKFEASYKLVPVPGLLYDLAQAHRLKGDCATARDFYSRFLDQVPTGPVESLARSHLAEMDRCVAAAAPLAAEARAATAAAAPSPPAPLSPPMAPSNLLATTVVTEHPPAPARRSRRFGRRAVWATGIAAIGLAATAGYFAWRANQSSEQVSGMFLPGQQWGAPGTDAQQSGRSSQALGIVSAVGALLSGGIALWLAKRN